MTRPSLLSLSAFLLLTCPSIAAPQPSADDAAFFEMQVRPLLAEHCWKCHGEKKQQGGLRLDSREAALEGGVIEPGKPEKSLLIQGIRRTGELKMPPDKPLPAPAVAALTHWIERGAIWPQSQQFGEPIADAARTHWAFQPVRKPPIPRVKDSAWSHSDIDRFILAKLEVLGLNPSPEADRRTLIRRVTFDLTGLPPTPSEVDAFLNDSSPTAYERLVDRLLASPHYGERWGRHWLDVARYADTKGYVFFEEPNYPWGWTYRDYVIEALNADLPYDQFIRHQLAADLLPLGDDKRPLRALGFVTLGGRFMSNPHDIIDDRIDVVTRGLLGMTVTCAHCHDHKFDPIPAKDYYSLYGVFASCTEPTVPPAYDPPPKTEQYAKFVVEMESREKKLRDFVRKKQAELVDGAKRRAGEYLLAAHAARNQPAMDDFMLIADGADLNPQMIVRWQAYVERARKRNDPVFALWHQFAVLPEKEFTAKAGEVVGRLKNDAAFSASVHPLIRQAFVGEPPKTMADVAKRYGDLLNTAEMLASRQAALSTVVTPALVTSASGATELLRQVLGGPDAPPSVTVSDVGDLALLPDRPSQAELQKLRKEVEQWRSTGAGAPPRAMVLQDEPEPYSPRVFLRGNAFNLGESVPRQFLGVLAGKSRKPFAHGSGRLELANAIVSKDNPLTSRVLVNRVWLGHFGRGLVATPSDFGLRSDRPTHPELLDYLASSFVDNGWSLKKLHKQIVMSAAYRQRSDDRPDCRTVDPENTLLWRMNRRRLDFESTRDSLLAVAGKLDPKVGGPSFPNLFGTSRRTLYAHLDRLNVPGIYRTFDFPNPDATSPQRDETTVAPQALFMMNHPFVADCARGILTRSELQGEQSADRKVVHLYRLLFGREPTDTEMTLGREFLAGAGPQGWPRYVHALLVTNEFVFVD